MLCGKTKIFYAKTRVRLLPLHECSLNRAWVVTERKAAPAPGQARTASIEIKETLQRTYPKSTRRTRENQHLSELLKTNLDAGKMNRTVAAENGTGTSSSGRERGREI
jgi:hypothetical protein